MNVFSFPFHNSTLDKLLMSKLYDEKTFYSAFVKDLEHSKDEIIIESPFMTIDRVNYFLPTFKKLIKRGVKICVYTRIIEEQSVEMQYQAEKGIDLLEEVGVFVLPTNGYMHRKLAIIDKNIVWEGSLNILSQRKSSKVMRRIKDKKIAEEMLKFLCLSRAL